MHVEFLRGVYGAVKRRLNGASFGRVASGDLERDLRADDTRVRVALSILQETGLLKRGADLPRTASVCLKIDDPSSTNDGLAAFCRVAHLRPHQVLEIDLAAVARQASWSPYEIEQTILDWEYKCWLSYRPAGRDMLLELLTPPQDAAQRIELLLERQSNVQIEQVDEIVAYARTARCRHGYLNAYLGGRTIERCSACDNCIDVAPPPDIGLPGEREQLVTILRCVSEADWSWGKRSLERILCGDHSKSAHRPQLANGARNHPGFGALAFRAPTSVRRLLDRLVKGAFLQTRQLDHGGVVLELAPDGQAALDNPDKLDALVRPSKKPRAQGARAV
jgi:hypothetical protein